MDLERTLWMLALGFVVGLVTAVLMKGRGFGLIGTTLVGILGSFMGGFLLSLLPLAASPGLITALVTSVAGAMGLLFIASLLRHTVY